MPLEDILESIRRAARAEAEAIVADARSRAEDLLEDARSEAAAREEHLAHADDDRIRVLRRRTLSLAHLEAARERRAAREGVYADVIDRVTHRLRTIHEDPGYPDVLAMLLDESIAVLPEPKTVRVDGRDADLIRELLAARGIEAGIEEIEGEWGGVELEADGTRVRNDLGSRLARADGYLRYLAGELHPPLRGGAT